MVSAGNAEVVQYISALDLSPDEFVRRYVAENTPVILTDCLSSEAWARAREWTPERLAELAPPGSCVHVAPLQADGRDKWLESADLWPGAAELEPLPGIVHPDRILAVAAARIDVSVDDFAASLHGRGPLPALYADGASNFDKSFGFLAKDLPGPPAVGDSLLFKRLDMWLGSRTFSTLHFDNYENLFAQLVGEKEFLLMPPGDTSRLVDGRLRKAYLSRREEDGVYERRASGLSDEAVMNYAAYDIHAPPAEYAERAGKLRRTVVRVRAGEVLYLPFGWWHQVTATPAEHGLCASAAFFFEPFFVRLQPKALAKAGPLLPNPKYRELCARLGLDDSDDDEQKPLAGEAAKAKGKGKGSDGYSSSQQQQLPVAMAAPSQQDSSQSKLQNAVTERENITETTTGNVDANKK
eukprot:gnl/TRDRNA2_/TRDRNA2_135197_c0_seq1.p1 gnl/TRDRNA2_/TRDRNA2_135197_c0~~gnl/TRDRNA2_/TRDRNA2_135197_c0_seq1.p1  ORF type:complete len:410 (+),score=95.91 gnl/TRDRNA2_/TRDRNA2_135197_c0_seq1:48-1277(+)